MSYIPRHSAPSRHAGLSRLACGAALVLGLPALVMLGASAPSYAVAPTCSLDGTELIATGEGVHIRVSATVAGDVQLEQSDDGETWLAVTCLDDEDAPIAVSGLTKLVMYGAGLGAWFELDVAPYVAASVPVLTTLDSGARLTLVGSEAADQWAVMEGEAFPSLNLDADADAELVLDGAGADVHLLTGSGVDSVDLSKEGDLTWPIPHTSIATGDGGDVVLGGPGIEYVVPGAGVDTVDTGDGADEVTIAPDAANDSIVAGTELDRLHFEGFVGVRVELGTSNNGAAGENDALGYFPYVHGTDGDDTFVSTASHEYFDGSGDTRTNDNILANDGPGDLVTYAHKTQPITVFGLGADVHQTNIPTAVPSSPEVDSLERVEQIVGTPIDDILNTQTDDLTFRPGLGNDTVTSTGARTRLLAEPASDGADKFETGDGQGHWDYSLRTTPVHVTIDNLNDDGVPGTFDDLGKELTPGEEDFVVDAEIAKVTTGSGADILFGDSSSDQFLGGSGNDYLNGRGGGDLLDGQGADDKVYGGSGDDQVNGGSGNDTLDGGAGDDREFGDSGNDTFNQANGGQPSGSDRLIGDCSTSPEVPCPGLDTVTYLGRAAGVVVKLDGSYGSGAPEEEDRISPDVEKAVGTNFNDNLAGGTGNNILIGNAGNDMIRGNAGNDQESGGDGNDTFAQNSARNGSDLIYGDGGTDTVTYADRNDTFRVGVSKNGLADDGGLNGTLSEKDNVGITVEVVIGTKYNDGLSGSAGADRLLGGGGDDTIRAGGGNDSIDGGLGSDSMYGDAGNDLLYARDSVKDKTLNGGIGTDKARRDSGDPITSIEGTF